MGVIVVDLVTNAQARYHMRIDTADDDPWLAIWIPSVSAQVLGWLKDEWRLYVLERDSNGDIVLDSDGVPVPAEDSDGNPILHPSVIAAALLELATQYRFREGEGDNVVPSDAGHGYVLSKGATAQLVHLRKTTVT